MPTSPLGNAATAVTMYIIQHAGTANMPNTIFKLVESASRVLECHYYPHMSFALPSYGRCSICVPNTSSHATKYRICLHLCDFSSCLSCNRMHFTESQCGMYGRQSTAGTHAGKAKVCATSRDDHTARHSKLTGASCSRQLRASHRSPGYPRLARRSAHVLGGHS